MILTTAQSILTARGYATRIDQGELIFEQEQAADLQKDITDIVALDPCSDETTPLIDLLNEMALDVDVRDGLVIAEPRV